MRIDVDAAAGVARADEVGVAVPYFARIETVPGGGDELVACEVRGECRSTGIPEALLGPQAPCADAGGRGGAAGQKT